MTEAGRAFLERELAIRQRYKQKYQNIFRSGGDYLQTLRILLSSEQAELAQARQGYEDALIAELAKPLPDQRMRS